MQLEEVLQRMEAGVRGPEDFPVKAAFVTFNYESERTACLDNMPRGAAGPH